MDIDLNEDNYDYEKLLSLFSLPEDFDESDLRNAKRKVLRLHPDKCGLDKEYFIFFLKMYKKIEQIYQYVHHETDVNKLNKSIDINDHFKKYLESKNINPRNNFKEFSKEFNKMFEQVYISTDDNTGYDDWLKSDDGIYDKDDIEGSRRKALNTKALVETRQDIEEVGNNVNEFSSLKCFDVKESHSNPIFVIDVEKEYAEKPKFRNVHEYQQFLRKEDDTNVPIGLQQSNHLLHRREQMLNNQAKNLAFTNMQNNEQMSKRYNSYISNYLKLEN